MAVGTHPGVSALSLKQFGDNVKRVERSEFAVMQVIISEDAVEECAAIASGETYALNVIASEAAEQSDGLCFVAGHSDA